MIIIFKIINQWWKWLWLRDATCWKGECPASASPTLKFSSGKSFFILSDDDDDFDDADDDDDEHDENYDDE